MPTTTISTATDQRITLLTGDNLEVTSTGSVIVGDEGQAVRFNAPTNNGFVTNSGTIQATDDGGRAIRFEDTVGLTLNAQITNNAGAHIIGDDDAIQLEGGATVNSGTLTIVNHGEIFSTEGQGIDLGNAHAGFTLSVSNSSTGTIIAEQAAGIQISGALMLDNNGEINGGSDAAFYDGNDGVDFQDDAAGTVHNFATGSIEGDRHGINAGDGTSISVINDVGGTIKGRNGSGVGSDGTGSVINHGTITGAFNTDGNAADENGTTVGEEDGGGPDGTADGDGDGVDIDGQATIENFGTIEGTGAGGTGSDGRSNTSEGIATGGGTITNHDTGTISGDLGILIDDSSTGNAPFRTTITNDGIIEGAASFGIRLISVQGDTIDNAGTISGGAGTAIQFGGGDDTLRIRTGSVINGTSDGGAGADRLDYSLFTAGATVNLGTGAATGTGGVANFSNVTGSAQNDTITGDGLGNDLRGNTGLDTLHAGAGDDTLGVADGDDTAGETYDGGADIDTLSLSDDATGGASDFGNDTVNSIEKLAFSRTAAGSVLAAKFNAIQFGGTGVALNLAVTLDANPGQVEVTMGASTAFSMAGFTFTGTGTFTTIVTGDTADETITGTSRTDVLEGKDGNDALDGGAGADFLDGLAGNDTYALGAEADGVDTVSETTGTDTITSTITRGLDFGAYAAIENLVLLGAGNINATGNALANTLTGNAGNNVLNGGVGSDTLQGLAGNDTYMLEAEANGVDTVTESAGGGTDTIVSNVSRSLNFAGFAQIENLTILDGTSATGNALANTITGNDTTNVLDGLTGVDRLVGGNGNDTYRVDTTIDAVVEAAGAAAGTVDQVIFTGVANQTYTLAANVENLTLAGTAATRGGGNVLANVITGNIAANILNGLTGLDRLIGGNGNDTYYVDTTIDTVVEAAGAAAGTLDQVIFTGVANQTYVLAANVENLLLAGTAATRGTGNVLANVITGNAAANVLNGLTGLDRLVGGNSNDTYYVDTTIDTVVEAAGTAAGAVDQVIFTGVANQTYVLAANVEMLTLAGVAATRGTGNVLNNTLTGNAGANVLDGGQGNDVVKGMAGSDVLTGGVGLDTLNGGDGIDYFVFNAPLDAANRDVITNFSHQFDTIRLENAVMAGLGAAVGPLNGNAFFAGAAAHDADDRIIYNKANGALIYDSNGNAAGGATLLAILQNKPADIVANDFVVI